MNKTPRTAILVVEDDDAMRELMVEELRDAGYVVSAAPGGGLGIEMARAERFDIVITDLRMPEVDGFDLIRDIVTLPTPPHVIMVTAFGSIDTAIRAVKLGAFDYITKPFSFEALLLGIDKAIRDREQAAQIHQLKERLDEMYGFDNIVAVSQSMREVLSLVRRVAATEASVLITGESGTGKELIARALHQHSPRCDRPFVPVNVAAIPAQLIESELFGHKKGAFTDAHANRDGMFVEATGGTIFLDEIAELAPALQAKLLRVLQEHEIRPIGAPKAEVIDVRVVAATHRNLESMLKQGLFREDLYYRLNVIEIHLPPLRARPEDILPLAEHILAGHSARRGRRYAISREAQQYLLNYYWPGNIRELQNVIERAVALSRNDVISQDDLPTHVQEKRSSDFLAAAVARRMSISELERDYILRVLDEEAGNKSRAAARLGLDRKTLYRKLDEYAKDEPPRES